MVANKTQLVNAGLSPGNEGVASTRVKILEISGGSKDYVGGLSDWPEAFCERIIYRVGPDAGEAVISVQTDRGAPGVSIGGIYSHIPFTARGSNDFTPFTASSFLSTGGRVSPRGLWKIVVEFEDGLSSDRMNSSPVLFVGYITRMRIVQQAKQFSTFEVTAEDARFFLAKIPIIGAVGYNPTFEKFVYLLDGPMTFNEGMKPNRMSDPYGITNNRNPDIFPCFINKDHNRYNAEPKSPDFRRYISDTELEAAIEAGNIGATRKLRNIAEVDDFTVAEKWTPGHAWNYQRMLLDRSLLEGLVNDPSPPLDDKLYPSPWISNEVRLRPLARGPKGGQATTAVGPEFFKPRSTVGEDPLGGAASEITGLGETDPQGIMHLEFMDDLCKRVGNMALAVDYSSSNGGSMEIFPIRTTLATGESSSVTYGKKGRGSLNSIWLPTDGDETFLPDVESYDLNLNYEDVFSRFHIAGGKRWIQLTLSTQGSIATSDHLGYFHDAYIPADATEWRPWNILPTLAPAWTFEQLEDWLALPEVQQTSWRFPDVFRTWVIPDDQNYKELWDQDTDEGFQRFFERDRQLMANLVSSVYESTLGIYRSNRVKLPIEISRGYKGTRVLKDGTTKFGDETTESTIAQVGKGVGKKDDLFRIQPGVEILNDGGRIGFRLDINARMLTNYAFEDGTDGPAVSPWSWNGIRDIDNAALKNGLKYHARPYEMFITIPVEVDESLAKDIFMRTSGAKINTNGPELMLYRQAGDAYNQEMASHSMISLPFDGKDKFADPPETAQNRKYNDGTDELKARAQIMANRHGGVVAEGTMTLRALDLSYEAGYRIDRLRQFRGANKNSRDINIKTIASSVIHDFRNQKTTIEIRSLR